MENFLDSWSIIALDDITCQVSNINSIFTLEKVMSYLVFFVDYNLHLFIEV